MIKFCHIGANNFINRKILIISLTLVFTLISSISFSLEGIEANLNSSVVKVKEDKKAVCISKKICNFDDFEYVPSTFRTDLFLKSCPNITTSATDSSIEAARCYSYLVGFITALNMESFIAVQSSQNPVFCIEGPPDLWIPKLIKYVEDNPALKTKSIDYTFYQLLSNTSRCNNTVDRP